MNVLKLLAVWAVVGLLGAAARAEDKVDHAKLIVGKWEVSKADEGTVPPGTLIEFTKDGKMKVTAKKGDADMAFEGTYKMDGNKFTMTMKVGDDEKTQTITILSISDKEMSTEGQDGKKVTLKKAK